MVITLLYGAPGKIHLSFDLWTSCNYLLLLSKLNSKAYTILITDLYIGIVVYFIDTRN